MCKMKDKQQQFTTLSYLYLHTTENLFLFFLFVKEKTLLCLHLIKLQSIILAVTHKNRKHS